MAAEDVPVAARPRQVFPLLRRRLQALAHVQHRNAALLILNMAAQAAAGLVFWLVLTRVLHLPADEVGLGYAVIALGTTAAVIAKGGLDTALLRHVPGTGRAHADSLLRLAIALGAAIAVAACGILAALGLWDELGPAQWILAALIAVLLVATWLQDAVFLAEGRARDGTLRNLGAAAVRIALPAALVAIAVDQVVAVSWALALAAAAALGFALSARLPERDGPPVVRRAFLASAGRNAAGSAAEFLPGLLLAPIVLAARGADQAAYFGMAWTLASLLFLASAAISRSALATLVVTPGGAAACIRRAALQHLATVGPGAIGLVALAPVLLGVFGPGYATAALALAILALSIVAVAPAYLYLALLRARDRTAPLVAFPLAMVAALGLLAPALAGRYGLVGVACAWLAANLPFGAWAAWRLHQEVQEVMPDPAFPVGGRAHLE